MDILDLRAYELDICFKLRGATVNKKIVDGRLILTPDPGMILTNGEAYGVEATVEVGADESGWSEISADDYAAVLIQEIDNSVLEKARAYDLLMGVVE